MDKIKLPSGYKVYLPLLVLTLVIFLMLPRTGKFNYDYQKGAPWMYENLTAQIDFPLYKTDEQIQKEMETLGTERLPYFKMSDETVTSVGAYISSAVKGQLDTIRPVLVSALEDVYAKGVLPNMDLSGEDQILIQKGKSAKRYALSEVYSVEQARSFVRDAVNNDGKVDAADSLCMAAGIYDMIVPNLSYDKDATDMYTRRSVEEISLTSGFVGGGTLIVSKGEIVTAEIQQMLDSYKKEYETSVGYSGPIALLWLGNALFAIMLVTLLFLTICYTNVRIFENLSKYLYILTIFIVMTAACLATCKLSVRLLYLVPFTLGAMYLLAFFRKRVVLPVYILGLLPLLVFAHNGVELFFMYMVAGVVAIYTFGYFGKGWRQFVNSFFVFLALLSVWVVFRLLDGVGTLADYRAVGSMFLGAFLLVAGYPMVYLFEKIFMLVSSTRLQELCDTNGNALLKELSIKAPGTFQHSLQVMNMCDAAASAIGADVSLVRAGAMYHDVGKMSNPMCFVENTAGTDVNIHSTLSPAQSAKMITRHVTDGLEIAQKYGVPKLVRSFIETHHGNASTGYFYTKYLNEGGSPDSEEAKDFFYKGQRPSTKEQVILMICDSLEAAARSLQDKTVESIDALVEKIINGKIADSQITDSDITMHELYVVKDVCRNFLVQTYHPRVSYPEKKSRNFKKNS
ncbi:MAG: HDIG domain-containing protein [Bacteroidales bacterium]|nr:HDIG domain-containing protein [Bacteroidales bacterium]